MPDPSPSTLTVLNSNFLQLGRRSGGRPQRTVYPCRLPINGETHCVSGDRIIEPTIFRLLVRCAISCATENQGFCGSGVHVHFFLFIVSLVRSNDSYSFKICLLSEFRTRCYVLDSDFVVIVLIVTRNLDIAIALNTASN